MIEGMIKATQAVKVTPLMICPTLAPSTVNSFTADKKAQSEMSRPIVGCDDSCDLVSWIFS